MGLGPRSPLLRRYRELASVATPSERGRGLETLVADLFRAAHFHVTLDPGTARPRQTDLVATLGHDSYLVETKWESTPAEIGDIDDVRVRLQETPGQMKGVLLSVAGFSTPAVNRVIARRDTPILLIDGTELEVLFEWPRGLRSFLRRKWGDLLRDAAVRFTAEPVTAKRRQPRATLPAADRRVVDVEGRPWNPLDCAGGFESVVFVDELPDVDWVPTAGHGVVVDLPLDPDDEAQFVGILGDLASRGWTSNRGSWSIQQAHTNWHGIGCREFTDALADWKGRYAALELVHHTEQAVYFDTLHGCLYTLSADLLARDFRRVDHCNLSFQFVGVPVDPSPLRDLAEAFEVEEVVYFRPLAERAVDAHRVMPDDFVDLPPLGFVVDDESDPKMGLTVVGVIVENPFRGASQHAWWPAEAVQTEALVCSLRSWHPFDEPRRAYHLSSVEWTRSSDAFVLRPVADWHWKDTKLGHPPWGSC